MANIICQQFKIIELLSKNLKYFQTRFPDENLGIDGMSLLDEARKLNKLLNK